MKKKLSIDRIGTRGSIALLILGIFCLVFGTYLQIQANRLPEDALEVTATISGFEGANTSTYQTTATLVTYTVNDITYRDIPLGQYEGSWKIGDTVMICCHRTDPTHIWTRTMQYRGIFYLLFSASFLIVAIYKLLQFHRLRRCVNDPDNDSDLSDSGQEKFRVSSFIIPLAAGIPFTINGILYWLMEHSLLGVVIALLGGMAILTGVFSLIDFFRQRKSFPAP